MYDVVVVGKGPAGISAALYCKRAGLSVLVIGMGAGALEKAEKIENYYGLNAQLTGLQVLQNGWQQAAHLAIEMLDAEVVDIAWDSHFIVSTNQESFAATSVILASGAQRKAPKLEGLTQLEGKGVSYCAVCDAFFYRGKQVAVFGAGAYALHEANDLLPVAGKVTLFTNGQPLEIAVPPELEVCEKPLAKLIGEDRLESAQFTDGTSQQIDGFFVALGSAGAGAFAKKLGLAMNGIYLETDAKMATAIPGLYAAGDCVGGIQQVSTAVAEGTQAAFSAIAYLRSLKQS